MKLRTKNKNIKLTSSVSNSDGEISDSNLDHVFNEIDVNINS